MKDDDDGGDGTCAPSKRKAGSALHDDPSNATEQSSEKRLCPATIKAAAGSD